MQSNRSANNRKSDPVPRKKSPSSLLSPLNVALTSFVSPQTRFSPTQPETLNSHPSIIAVKSTNISNANPYPSPTQTHNLPFPQTKRKHHPNHHSTHNPAPPNLSPLLNPTYPSIETPLLPQTWAPPPPNPPQIQKPTPSPTKPAMADVAYKYANSQNPKARNRNKFS